MNKEVWAQMCANVTQRMSQHVSNFVTPLSMSEAHGSGVAWGSGTYIQGAKHVWVLTAGHVVWDVPAGGRLAHLPVPRRVGEDEAAGLHRAGQCRVRDGDALGRAEGRRVARHEAHVVVFEQRPEIGDVIPAHRRGRTQLAVCRVRIPGVEVG